MATLETISPQALKSYEIVWGKIRTFQYFLYPYTISQWLEGLWFPNSREDLLGNVGCPLCTGDSMAKNMYN